MTIDLVKKIQSHIETIYNINIGESASDYLVGYNEVVKLLQVNQNTSLPSELFLVNPNPENEVLEVALFFDDRLQQNLANHSPFEGLHEKNISDFCTLIEGISHFVYYLFKMGMQHNVSELELELQAEIDKYVLLCFFVQAKGYKKTQIMDLLFENYFLNDSLTPDQKQRYQSATELAKRYCYKLSRDFSHNDLQPLVDEIRLFYPLSHNEKINLIVK